ncbi:MAG: hypothetical protein PHF63_00810 [Herbinix sp.]|nr:hypothetical protein [Herbinix sp.]
MMRYKVVCVSIWTTTAWNKFGSVNDKTCGLVYTNDEFDVTELKTYDGATRAHMTSGMWVTVITSGGTTYAKMISKTEEPPIVPEPNPVTGYEEYEEKQVSAEIDADMYNMLLANSRKNSDIVLGTTKLYGSPFQFLPSTDYRSLGSNDKIGRTYAQYIIGEAPIVSLMPGKPFYLPSTSDSQRKSLEALMGGSVSGVEKTAFKEIISTLKKGDTRYFDFQTDYNTYMTYVNFLCRLCAYYLGIEDETAPGSTVPFKKFNWKNYKFRQDFVKYQNYGIWDTVEQGLNDATGKYRYVEFFADSNSSMSESASNSTTNSMFEGLISKGSQLSREAAFLGTTFGTELVEEIQGATSEALDDFSQLSSTPGFAKRLLGTTSHIVMGSNINFPEIWNDSSFSKSYTVNLTLISPYGDPYSVYLNVIVPMLHALAFSLPRQTSGNTYSSPFLVRGFSKGWFSCENGIVDSISIEKGGDGARSVYGFPTEVRISMSIKDLFSQLQMSNASNPGMFYNNIELMQFLGTTCGLNLTDANIKTRWDSLMRTMLNVPIDVPTNLVDSVKDDIQTFTERFLGGWL